MLECWSGGSIQAMATKKMKTFTAVIVLTATTLAFASDKKPKAYAESGVVENLRELQKANDHGDCSAYGGDSFNTFERTVYVVKTERKTLEIAACEKGRVSKDRPDLNIGQSLSFRDDGTFLYTVLGDGKEHRYYILSAQSGVVESFHALQEVSGSGYSLPSGYGSSSVDTFERRVYVVKTENTRLEITPWESRGDSKHRPELAIGQSISFRDDGKYLYTVLNGKEHRYSILSAAPIDK
jgi:DNA-binding beta-propeller fold protein YncE